MGVYFSKENLSDYKFKHETEKTMMEKQKLII